jgi:hypothetical protein
MEYRRFNIKDIQPGDDCGLRQAFAPLRKGRIGEGRADPGSRSTAARAG